jgi:UPF0042 nucleotide-binding protein
MSRRRSTSPATRSSPRRRSRTGAGSPHELVIITGMSGSGKASVLKAFEDLGYYCVDNLPVELIPAFAEISMNSEVEKTALVIDIREGQGLRKLPAILKSVRRRLATRVIFLEASEESLIRRFSETRRPHPLGRSKTVPQAIAAERTALASIRALADVVIDTSRLNVHELRARATRRFRRTSAGQSIAVTCISFGFRHGLPQECDLVFDVRFLPNPHFIPALQPFTGKHPKVARYVRSFPQTRRFIDRISSLLIYLLPHYIREGKSYLTIGFGCTGGKHRSVMIAEDVARRLARAGYDVRASHRDIPS